MDSDRRYCVYFHKTLDGEIFYVGSGTLERALRKELSESKRTASTRGKKYSEKVKELGFEYDVDIVVSGLTKEESISLETMYIKKYSYTIVNTNVPIINSDTSNLKEIFYYNEDSPSLLSWKIKHHYFNIGDPVNTHLSKGYLRVHYKKTRYFVHRVVASLFDLDINGKVVDHVDGDKLNNSIDNLRVVSQKENRKNSRKSSKNKSGFSGLSFSDRRQHWVFNWYENFERKAKTFHIKYFNNDKTLALESALMFRKEELLSLGYTENHINDFR